MSVERVVISLPIYVQHVPGTLCYSTPLEGPRSDCNGDIKKMGCGGSEEKEAKIEIQEEVEVVEETPPEGWVQVTAKKRTADVFAPPLTVCVSDLRFL